jgi:hypothetical protein
VQPPKLTWRIDEIAASLDFQTGLNIGGGRLNVKLTARSIVTITPESPQDIEWFIQKVWRFCYLLTLLTDERVSPTDLLVNLPDDTYQAWLLYRSGADASPDPAKALPVFLFHLAHVIDGFQPILARWFAADDTMLDAIHLTMDAHRNPDQSTHGRFLLLAHATEVISRATTASESMSAEKYKAVIAALNQAIPEDVPKDHRASLKSRIKYGNEHAFHKRITLLIGSLSPEGAGIVCNSPALFARGISDTRNYYTHFTDELRPKALRGAALYWASEKLLLLLRILLLKYLGIEKQS